MRKIKVAIYSGVIPSTTFIENLVKAVASEQTRILLFGQKRKDIIYQNKGIAIYANPRFRWMIIPLVYYNKFKLRAQSHENFMLLSKHISLQNLSARSRLFLWYKYLPIILHLPDIFHIQWVKGCGEWLFLKELFNVKLIVSMRGAQINYKPLAAPALRELYKHNFPFIDGFHAVSHDIANNAEIYGATKSKTRVIYSGVDFHLLNNFEKFALNKSGNSIQIISVGRIHWKKGYHFALDALKKLNDKGYSFHYTIIAALDEEEILYQISDLGLNDIVTLHKSMPQKDVFRYMQQADLLLLPSFEEGVANVVLEAMAIGLPVLSSDCGGMAEVITHDVNGYLYKKRELNDLVDKLEYFCNDSQDHKLSVIEFAKKYVRQNHTLEDLGLNMSAFYRDLMNNTK